MSSEKPREFWILSPDFNPENNCDSKACIWHQSRRPIGLAHVQELIHVIEYSELTRLREQNRVLNNAMKAIKDYCDLHSNRRASDDVQYIHAIEQKCIEAISSVREGEREV